MRYNFFIRICVLMILLVFVSGCVDNIGFSVGTTDPAVQANSFEDYSSLCDLHTDVNLSNTSICSVGSYPSLTWYDNTTPGWSMLCCNFDHAHCAEQNFSDVEDICVSNTSSYDFFVTHRSAYRAVCCNINNQNCYVDMTIIPGDNSTVCDMDYTSNTMSVTFINASALWNTVCCEVGIERSST